MPKFKYGDMEINYLSEGTGEPFVLIIGYGSQMKGWSFQVDYFKDKMNVISMDNRGTGQSSRHDYPYTMEMFIEDIRNLLEHLKIHEKIHLCGISMGGGIVQHFALRYPERVKTLILLATMAKTEPSPLIEGDEVMSKMFSSPEAVLKTRLSSLYTLAFRKKIKKDKELFESISSAILENPTTLQDYKNQAAALSQHDTIDSLPKIEIPTLIMAGTKDLLVPHQNSEILHEGIPNSKLEIIDGVGHGFIVEAADKVNNIMWNFIKEHLG